MLFIIYLTAAILLTTAFCATDKHLHLFEILAALMAIECANAIFSTYLLVNWEYVVVPDGSERGLVRILNIQALEPLIIVWIRDTIQGRSKSVRLFCYLLSVGMITLTAWLLSLEHVISMSGVRGWAGLVAKEAVLPLAGYAAIGYVRYLMRKDGMLHKPVSRNK